MKKKNITFCALLALVMAGGCKDDFASVDRTEYEGNEVVFAMAGNPNTRTVYQDNWDQDNKQNIYWGNYLSSMPEDQIKIYCKQGARQIATYKVDLQDDASSSAAKSITKTGIYGIQWGNSAETHNFYAFYPASKCADSFVDDSGNVINVEVTPGQAPVNYRLVQGDNEPVTTGALAQAYKNDVHSAEAVETIYGQPDMSAAVMYASTSVGPDKIGDPVSLKFNVFADVLDITINGPVIDNTLGGNSNKVPRKYIDIRSVTIKSNSGASLTGRFDIDMSNGNVANITNGNNTILLNTTITENGKPLMKPRLWARANENTNGNTLDKLRVRAFMIPGQVQDLSDLTITVSTDCGEYSQQLVGVGNVTSGAIHRLKMKYFKARGKDFDFKSWIAQLDPNIYINELSIPGTWHSPSSTATNNVDKCQFLTMAEQYDAGIRAFEIQTTAQSDLRVTVNGLSNVTISDVLNEIGEKLSDDEFVVFEIGRSSSENQNLWPKAVEAELKKVTKLYTDPITRNTTIDNVKGKIIAKINTNNTSHTADATLSDVEKGWTENTPALFSRWVNGSAKIPMLINMQWGNPVAPYTEGTSVNSSPDALKWYFTQGDQIGAHCSLEERCNAILNYMANCYGFYKDNLHNTWYYCLIGGYSNSWTSYQGTNVSANDPASLAAQQNMFMIQALTNQFRSGCPLGLIMMNYAGPEGNTTAETANSPAVIREIINNNMAFTLNRATATEQNAEEKTNSLFRKKNGNSIR